MRSSCLLPYLNVQPVAVATFHSVFFMMEIIELGQ